MNVSLRNVDDGPVVEPISALVLDDDDFDRRRLRRMSEASGLAMNFVSVPTISQMLTCLDETAFDLIFLDYRLSNETGLEALDLVQEHQNCADSAKIMLTGHLKVEVAVAALKNGCHDYISKDALNPDNLRQTVEKAIGRLRSAQRDRSSKEKMIDQAVLALASKHLPELLAKALSSKAVRDVAAPFMRSTVRNELSQALTSFAELNGMLKDDEIRNLLSSLDQPQQITWTE